MFSAINVICTISINLKMCVIDLLFIRALAANILFGVDSTIQLINSYTPIPLYPIRIIENYNIFVIIYRNNFRKNRTYNICNHLPDG